MSALPRPDLAPGPTKSLNDALHDLHHHAGWPSLRVLARDTGVSHTTVSKAFSQPGLPSWGILELLVEAMGGDAAEFHDLWLAASAPTHGAPSPAPRIAGRRAELAAVRHHLESGSGLLLVTGEAGIGKTTLVRVAADLSNVVVARGNCLPLSSEVPLLPVVDALLAARRADRERFDDALAHVPPAFREQLGRLLPDVEAHPDAVDDQFGRQRQFLAVTEMVEALATAAAQRVLVEDLHWADHTSLDWLEHHLSRGSQVPLVGTWRTADSTTSSRHEEWLGRVRRCGNVRLLHLSALSEAETAEQVRLLAPSRDDERFARIYARSLGHPLFTEHLTREVDDTDELPHELASFLDDRLDRLSDHARAVASMMAVADRALPVGALAHATQLAPGALTEGLGSLRAARLMIASPTDEVALVHPLWSEAVRRRLLPGETAALHGAVAELLAESGDAAPAELAAHWQAARRPDRELACRIAAARQAHERLAFRQELTSLLRALELHDTVAPSDCPPLWVLLRDAIRVAVEVADLVTARRLAERALTLEVPEEARVQVLEQAGEALYEVGAQATAMRLLDEAHDLLLRLPPSAGLVQAVISRFWTLVQAGRTARALQDAEVDLTHFTGVSDPRLSGLRYSHDLVARLRMGDFEGALAVNEARAGSIESGDLISELSVAVNTTDVLLRMGASPTRVREAAGPMLRLAEHRGLDATWAVSLLRTNVAWACLRAGDTPAAAAVLESVTRRDPTALTWLLHQAMAAVEVRRGLVDDGLARSRAAQRVATPHDMFWAEGAPWDADTMLWAGVADGALGILDEALVLVVSTDNLRNAGELLACLARATADRVGSTTDVPRRRAARDGVIARYGQGPDPFGVAGVEPSTIAFRHQWEGELARIMAAVDPAPWIRAALEWERLHRPHDAAYCRWRAGQCALRGGDGTRARQLLRKAAADAREHVPLARAIATTAVTGRA